MVNLHNGCVICHKNDFTEFITEGIKQQVSNNDGYIVSEVTTYTKDVNDAYVKCNSCGKRYDEFEF